MPQIIKLENLVDKTCAYKIGPLLVINGVIYPYRRPYKCGNWGYSPTCGGYNLTYRGFNL